MFHSSESIILKDRRFKSKKKPDGKDGHHHHHPTTTTPGPLRTRASTWSSATTTTDDHHLRRKISLAIQKPFHHHHHKRQSSITSPNSNQGNGNVVLDSSAVDVSKQQSLSPLGDGNNGNNDHVWDSNELLPYWQRSPDGNSTVYHTPTSVQRGLVSSIVGDVVDDPSRGPLSNPTRDYEGKNAASVGTTPTRHNTLVGREDGGGTGSNDSSSVEALLAEQQPQQQQQQQQQQQKTWLNSTSDKPWLVKRQGTNDHHHLKHKKSFMVQHLALPKLSMEDGDANSRRTMDTSDTITPRASGSNTFSCMEFSSSGDFPISLSSSQANVCVHDDVEENDGNAMEDDAENDASEALVYDDDNIYPPNINVQVGSLPLSKTLTDESETCTELKDVACENEEVERERGENRSMSAQKSHDTLDTPNSWGSSRVSVVRFLDNDVAAPTSMSHFRKPPPSLLLEEDGVDGDDEEGQKKKNYREMYGLVSDDALVGKVDSVDIPKVYSYDVDNMYLEPNNRIGNSILLPRDMIPHHDRQQSLGQSTIDSLEYSSMRNMDSDRMSKLSLLFGENSSDGDTENESPDDAKGNNDNNPTTRAENEEAWKWLNTCWCLPHAPKLSWSRVSSTVVRYAPCFWCCLRRSGTGGTDRVTLTRLNVLCIFFALWQFGVGIFIMVVFLSNRIVDRNLGEGVSYRDYYKEALTPNLWMMSGSLLILSVVGFVLLVTMILTIPVIRQVNLIGAIRFMWVLYWILPLQIFLVIALFDYHNVTDVWIKHWWTSPSMAWFRYVFCDPGTANNKCAAPFLGGENYTSIDEWCEGEYGSNDCASLRSNAIDETSRVSYFFFYLNAILGGVLVILLLLSLGLLEGLISAPIVQRSKETNVPLWLTFPIIFCFGGGFVLLFSPQSFVNDKSGTNIYWISVCYILSGATFTVSALLGWFM
jgi:hypothetical protein